MSGGRKTSGPVLQNTGYWLSSDYLLMIENFKQERRHAVYVRRILDAYLKRDFDQKKVDKYIIEACHPKFKSYVVQFNIRLKPWHIQEIDRISKLYSVKKSVVFGAALLFSREN